jgi:hypothetical protein
MVYVVIWAQSSLVVKLYSLCSYMGPIIPRSKMIWLCKRFLHVSKMQHSESGVVVIIIHVFSLTQKYDNTRSPIKESRWP